MYATSHEYHEMAPLVYSSDSLISLADVCVLYFTAKFSNKNFWTRKWVPNGYGSCCCCCCYQIFHSLRLCCFLIDRRPNETFTHINDNILHQATVAYV